MNRRPGEANLSSPTTIGGQLAPDGSILYMCCVERCEACVAVLKAAATNIAEAERHPNARTPHHQYETLNTKNGQMVVPDIG